MRSRYYFVFLALGILISSFSNDLLFGQQSLSFSDITLSAGTGGPEANKKTGGHAAIFADVDGDGRPDLYITMLFKSPMPDLFFWNRGNNEFESDAAARGIDDDDGGSHGATFADLDNDGDYDLLNGTTDSTPSISARNNLFRNDGHGFFKDVSEAGGLPDRDWPTRGIVAFDMDRDGDLDIFGVTNYQGSDDPPGERNEIYRNDGNLRFTAITSGDLYEAPVGQGATDTDYDGDGDIDIIAGNRTGDVNILRNDGSGNFTRVRPADIGIHDRAGDGISTADIDNDGDLDMLLVGSADGNLYRNNGDGTFEFSRSFSNIDGFMGGFADLDHDGDLDLVFAGYKRCFLNDGTGDFRDGPDIPVKGIDDPRAVAFADIDDDGDMDFAFGVKRSRNWLVRNNFNSGNWLKVELISPDGQAGAFGAKTTIYPSGQAGGEQLGLRESRSNTGYLGQDDPVMHFGLGDHSHVDVVVDFLDGTRITRSNVEANQKIVIDGREVVVERFDQFELVLDAKKNYDTPYRDASVTATFVGPTESKSLPGFWDGGDIWRVRFSPGQVGQWTYSTTSKDAGLVTSGSFQCVPSARKGGIRPRPQAPLHFEHQDGTPFWWFGETAWAAFRSDPAENLNSRAFRQYIDRRAEQGFNYVHGNLLAGPNEGGNPFSTPVVGDEINPEFWQEVDRRVRHMNDNGMTAGLMLAWKSDKKGAGSSSPVMDYDWTDFPDQAARLRYCEYIAARYSAYDVVWILSGEYNEAPDRQPNNGALWSDLAYRLRENDPHGRMMAIHGQSTVETFADEGWMSFGDYMQLYSNLNSAIIDARDHAKPVVNAEYGYFLRDKHGDGVVTKANSASIEEFRHASWDIAMAGGYFVSGFGTTYLGGKREYGPFEVDAPKNDPAEVQIPLIKDLFTSIEWWNLQPANDLMSGSGMHYCLTDFAGTYLAYVRGNSISVKMQVVEGSLSHYTVKRFDPRTGTLSGLPNQTTSSALNLDSPNQDDWVFLVTADGSPPTLPVISHFTPQTGQVGSQVTIMGLHFKDVSAVEFNGVTATEFSVPLDTEIIATVPSNATSGPIRVIAAGGLDTSAADFSMLAPSPHNSISVLPIADTYVRSDKERKNYGDSDRLRVKKSSSLQRTYLKFDLTAISAPPATAFLKLKVANGSDDAGTIHLVANSYNHSSELWTEKDLTWENAPEITMPANSTGGAAVKGEIVEFDVSRAITGSGIYSFAIQNRSSNTVKFNSKESSSPPQLLLTFDSAQEPRTPPSISSFTPTSGKPGGVVSIFGEHLAGVSEVMVGGTPSAKFEITSETQLVAEIPAAAVTGKIKVQGLHGTAESQENFTVEQLPAPPTPPEISHIEPQSGTVGSQVTITGLHFNGLVSVEFNGVSATEIVAPDETQIVATVPRSTVTGPIRVATPAGIAASATDFTIVVPSNQSSITLLPLADTYVRSDKTSKNYGDSDRLRVKNSSSLQRAYLKFDVPAIAAPPVTVALRLHVSNGSNHAGAVHVVANTFIGIGELWTEDRLTWDNAPEIVSPAMSAWGEASKGDLIEFDLGGAIKGPGLYSFAIQNASSNTVKFHSKETATPPELVLTFVSGENPGNPLPSLTSFSPTSGTTGTAITLLGDNLASATQVSFGGGVTSQFNLNTASLLVAPLPSGAATGKIQVTTPNGSAISRSDFTVETASPTPAIGRFTPESGAIGSQVTIEGQHFNGISAVNFNGVTAAEFSIASETKIRATVPAGATTGPIQVLASFGSAISRKDFQPIPPETPSGPQTLTFQPTDDSFVWSKKPSNNYQASTDLRVRQTNSAEQIAYFKFQVQGAVGVVTRATLRLYVTDGSNDGGSVRQVSNDYEGSSTPWKETGLEWPNAPRPEGPTLTSTGPVEAKKFVEFDVTPTIAGDGHYSYAVSNSSSDAVYYSSKEGTTAPELVIEVTNSTTSGKFSSANGQNQPRTGQSLALPDHVVLGANYPNPFNTETTIHYGLPAAGHVRVQIYNIQAQLIRTLIDADLPRGLYKITWNGTNDLGLEVSSGVYFAKLTSQTTILTEKLLLQK